MKLTMQPLECQIKKSTEEQPSSNGVKSTKQSGSTAIQSFEAQSAPASIIKSQKGLKTDISSLIGRKLVPFFEDGECEGTPPSSLQPNLERNNKIDNFEAQSVLVREFKNGYFEDAQVVHSSKKTSQKSRPRSAKSSRRKRKAASRKSAKNLDSHSMSYSHFADPKWLTPPTPDSIPTPKFLQSEFTSQSSDDSITGVSSSVASHSDSHSHSMLTGSSSSVATVSSVTSSPSSVQSSRTSTDQSSVRPLSIDAIQFVPGGQLEPALVYSQSEPVTPSHRNEIGKTTKSNFQHLLDGDSFEDLKFSDSESELSPKNLSQRRASLPPRKSPRAIKKSSTSDRGRKSRRKTAPKRAKSFKSKQEGHQATNVPAPRAQSDPEIVSKSPVTKWASVNISDILAMPPVSASVDSVPISPVVSKGSPRLKMNCGKSFDKPKIIVNESQSKPTVHRRQTHMPAQSQPHMPAQSLPHMPAQTQPRMPAQSQPLMSAQSQPRMPAQTQPVHAVYYLNNYGVHQRYRPMPVNSHAAQTSHLTRHRSAPSSAKQNRRVSPPNSVHRTYIPPATAHMRIQRNIQPNLGCKAAAKTANLPTLPSLAPLLDISS
eukprot:961928_1